MSHRIIIGNDETATEYGSKATLSWSPPDSMSLADQKAQYGRVLKRYQQALHEMDPALYPDPGE